MLPRPWGNRWGQRVHAWRIGERSWQHRMSQILNAVRAHRKVRLAEPICRPVD
jgi:hypothetical protein